MSTTVAPPIPLPIGAILFSLITLGYGILWEKYFVERSSMIFNTLDIVVLGITTPLVLFDIPYLGFIPLVSYVVLGWRLVRVEGYCKIKQLFGSKMFGSISLAIAMDGANGSVWVKQFIGLFGANEYTSFFQSQIVLTMWIAIIVVVILLQIIVIKKNIKLRI